MSNNPGINSIEQQPLQEKKQHPLANYQFSADELRTLRECDYEALFQRSMPLGISFGLTAYYAVKNNYLKPSLKWGPTPKVVIGVIFGYFLGKFSYQNRCAEKIMRLPDSKLAEMLRMRRKGGIYENLTPDQGFGTGLALAPFSSATEQYSDELSKSTTLNLDTERPSVSGLDDTHRPNVDRDVTTFEDDLPLKAPTNQTSYDELRQQNREEYAKKKQNPYYRPVTQDVPVITRPTDNIEENMASSIPLKGPKNKYGDVWTQ